MPRFAPTTRYRYGDRDRSARTAHAAESKRWRREIAVSLLGPVEQEVLFAALRAGFALAQAARAIDLTTNAIYGRAAWDEDFRDQLDEVLDETCPAGEWCGRASGVKKGGHCRACREAHHPPRPTARGKRRTSRK